MPYQRIRITPNHLQTVIAQARAKQINVSVDTLDETELAKFESFFNRMLIVHDRFQRWQDIHLSNVGNYLLGLAAAKKQFDGANFGGAIPGGAEYGIDQFRAGYVAVGQDWTDEGQATGGTAKNWIHAGGSLLGGTSGNDIRFLSGFVGVVTGFGDFRHIYYGLPSGIETFQIRKDNRTLKPIYVGTNFKLSTGGFPIVELDDPIILKDRTQLRIQYMTADTSTNVPFLTGVVFGLEGSLNKLDATDLDGTSNKLYEAT